MRILCYAGGPWCVRHLEIIAEQLSPKATIRVASPNRRIDEVGIARRYYELLAGDELLLPSTGVDQDMIMRCRILRSFDQQTAERHLHSMRRSVVEALEAFRPDVILTETIDAFPIDVIYHESQKRGIDFIGLVQSFVNGYVRVTARGEHQVVREPSDAEVEEVRSIIQQREYRPGFVKYSKSLVIKRWFRNWLKVPYFAVRRRVSGELYNTDYLAGEIVARQWRHLRPRLTVGDPEWRSKIAAQRNPVIYVPLQQTPEATVEYWCDHPDGVDYETRLLDTIRKHGSAFHFLIKEHPAVLGLRHPSLYRKLAALPGVTLCPTHQNSNEVIAIADSVLVWTGSVGFEAALRGVPVLAQSKAYYMTGPSFKIIDQRTTSVEISAFLHNRPERLGESEQNELVRHLLRGLIPGRLNMGWKWSESNPRDIEDAQRLGRALAAIRPIEHAVEAERAAVQ